MHELSFTCGKVASFQAAFKNSNTRATSLEGELSTKCVKFWEIEGQEAQWKKAYEELNIRTIGLSNQVEDLKEELVLVVDKARGQDIQTSFKVFYQLLLQL